MSPSNIDHPRKSLRSRSPNTWTIALISKSREHYDLSPLLTTHPHETHVSRTACRTDQWMANQRRRRASVGARMRGGRYDTRRATGCQTKTCRRQTNIACVSVVCFSSFLSRLPRYDGERRDPDHGVKRPCRVLSVCLAPLLVILSSSRLHDSPVNGHADPCICPIARTSDVCPGNCPFPTGIGERVWCVRAAWRTESWKRYSWCTCMLFVGFEMFCFGHHWWFLGWETVLKCWKSKLMRNICHCRI